MRRISEQKTKKLTKNQKKVIIISVLILIILAIIFGIMFSKEKEDLGPVANITSNTINIEFSTKEIVSEDIKIKLSTTTEYDIYYYIDLKNEETAEENILLSEDTENTVTNILIENSTNSVDNINNTSNVTNTTTLPNSIKIANNQYKKYKNEIVVKNNATVYLKYARENQFSESAYSFEVI